MKDSTINRQSKFKRYQLNNSHSLFQGPAGTQIADNPPNLGSYTDCGSGHGGWINGTHPKVLGESSTQKVCWKYYDEICGTEDYGRRHLWKDITIKNCGNFYVYFLTDTSGSFYARYCGQ